MNLEKHRRKLYILLIYLSLPLFIMFTNPDHLPLPLLIVPFMLLFIICYTSLRLILKPISWRKKMLISAAGASAPVLLLVFQSIHQLTFRDVLIVGSLIGVTTFYLSRADFIR
ncbi:MAG TPA: hypothetical protein VLF39_03325 [Candidatus Saccharimonadales bacterium]|nr:hypothetical protein [Candidatus Saccharimonadales bacterium]